MKNASPETREGLPALGLCYMLLHSDRLFVGSFMRLYFVYFQCVVVVCDILAPFSVTLYYRWYFQDPQ